MFILIFLSLLIIFGIMYKINSDNKVENYNNINKTKN
jgi:hypothetical protein